MIDSFWMQRGALAAAAGLVAGFGPPFIVEGTGPAEWGVADPELGIDGDSVIENFENAALIPGLQIGVTTPDGAYDPTSTLPATFNPAAQDPFGDAFESGVWDGARVLINTATNRPAQYADESAWGDVQLVFTTPVARVHFSVQGMNDEATVAVNGFPLGNLLDLAELSPGAGRNGYIMIESEDAAANPITLVQINNGKGDGFVIDHVAVRFIYCSGDGDGDGFVDFDDLNLVVSAFNSFAGEPEYSDAADFDDDGVVDFEDLNTVLASFNDACDGEVAAR